MSPEKQPDELDAWQFLHLANSGIQPEKQGETNSSRDRKLANLMAELPAVLKDAGCTCLANRLAMYCDNFPAPEEGVCSTQNQKRSTLNLLCQLQPLSKALREAGYYDHALSCAELARSIEPTLDLNLLRAYLFLALGDNEKACEIYRKEIRQLGTIPQKELDRLKQLATSHSAEDDLQELLTELNSCCKLQKPGN